MAATAKRAPTFSMLAKLTLDAHIVTRVTAFSCDWNEMKKRFDPPAWATSKDKVLSWIGAAIVARGVAFYRSDDWRSEMSGAESAAAIRTGRAVAKRFFPELF